MHARAKSSVTSIQNSRNPYFEYSPTRTQCPSVHPSTSNIDLVNTLQNRIRAKNKLIIFYKNELIRRQERHVRNIEQMRERKQRQIGQMKYMVEKQVQANLLGEEAIGKNSLEYSQIRDRSEADGQFQLMKYL